MMMSENIYVLILLVWFIVFTFTYGFVGAEVSGNAIDLANMNMNMMHMKCPLEPCQSVCLKKQPETGCFICDPQCNTRNNVGMPDTRLPINMQPLNTGQSSFYNGCDHNNWMQCPMSCQRKFDQKGCFKCLCKMSSTLRAPQISMQTLISTNKSTQEAQISTPRTKSGWLSSFPTRHHGTITTETSVSTTKNQHESRMADYMTTKAIASNTVYSSSKAKLFQNDIHLTPSNSDSNGQLKSTGYHNYDKNSSTISSYTDQNKLLCKVNEFKPNDLTFVLFGIMIALVTFCFVFFIAWRKSSQKLRTTQDELYFVHKTLRQELSSHFSINEMIDPVYSDITPRPDPPPRSTELNNTNVKSGGPFTTNITNYGPSRSFSQSSNTPLKENFYECKHDYLELI